MIKFMNNLLWMASGVGVGIVCKSREKEIKKFVKKNMSQMNMNKSM